MGRQLGTDPLTAVTLKSPPQSLPYRQISPLTLSLSSQKCLREVGEKGSEIHPLSPLGSGTPSVCSKPRVPITLGPLSQQEKGLFSPSARRFSLRCQRNPPTQEALESSKRPPTASSTGSVCTGFVIHALVARSPCKLVFTIPTSTISGRGCGYTI